MYILDKAYDLKHTRVFYSINTSLAYSDAGLHRYDVSKYSSIIVDPLDEELYRNTSLYNRIISFYFYTKDSRLSDFTEHFNKVNTDDVVVAGEVIPKHKGLLLEYTINKVNVLERDTSEESTTNTDSDTQITGSRRVDIYRITVLIEVEVEKPLYEVSVPIKGFFFKHPITGKKARIQFSSNPMVYTSNQSTYPNAIEVWNGYGFYSEDRPDLNVTEPVLLTEDGSILTNRSDIVFRTCVEKSASNWGCLGLPRETGIQEI